MRHLGIPDSLFIGQYFVIRHRPTGRYIPAVKRGRGTTFIDPSELRDQPPRLFFSRASAKAFLGQWLRGHLIVRDQDISGFIVRPVAGRKKEDMEIVPISVIINEGS